jgi:hypothetical protein
LAKVRLLFIDAFLICTVELLNDERRFSLLFHWKKKENKSKIARDDAQ